MMMGRLRIGLGIGVAAAALALVWAPTAGAQIIGGEYVFHLAGTDPQVDTNRVSEWNFGDVVKGRTNVSDLSVSLINYNVFASEPDTTKVTFVFEDAAATLIFNTQINVEFSGDTVKLDLTVDPGGTIPGVLYAYKPSSAPFSVSFRPTQRKIYEDTLTFIFTYPILDTLRFVVDGRGIGFLKLIDPNGTPQDSLITLTSNQLQDTRVGDSLPGSGYPVTIINTSATQLGKIEDVITDVPGIFHIVNRQLEIQPGETGILSVQFTPRDLGGSVGQAQIISDDFAVDTALINTLANGILSLDYFSMDDTLDGQGNTIHTVIDEFLIDTIIAGDTHDSLIWIQNRLNQNVETELVMHCGRRGLILLSEFGVFKSDHDTLYAQDTITIRDTLRDTTVVVFRDTLYGIGDTIFIGCDPILADTITFVPIVLARTLPLNDSMPVWVRFNPEFRGTARDSIETRYKPFIGEETTVTGLFPIEGLAIGASFGWDKDVLDFGPLTPGLALRDSVRLAGDPTLSGQLPVLVTIDTTGLDPVYTLLTVDSLTYLPGTEFYAVFEYAAVDALEHTDTVRVTSNDPNNPGFDLILTGGTQAPVIVPADSSIDFGDVVVSDSATQTLWIRNIGLVNLVVSSITVSQTTVLTPTPTNMVMIVPGDSQAVFIQFVPLAATSYDDTLVIVSDDPTSPSTRIPIFAGGSDPVYSADSTLVFGATTLNLGALIDSTGISNNGTRGDLICTVSVLRGTYFDLPDTTDAVIQVNAGTTFWVAVRFRQQVPEIVYDSLMLITNDPARPIAYITLSGGGFFKQLSWLSGPLADTTLYDYGKVSVEVAETLTSVMTNLGNDTLSVSSITLFDGSQGFTRITPGVTRLLQSEQFDVSVQFVPTLAGTFFDTMLIITDDTTGNNDSIIVPLQAQAYVPGLQLLSSSLVFDTTEIGTTVFDSIGLFNPGEDAVDVDEVTLAIGMRFNVAGSPGSVAPDDTGLILITFNPLDTIVYYDTLTVITADPVDTLVVTIEGTGAGGRYADDVDELLYAPTDVFATSQESFQVFNIGNRPLQITSITTQSGTPTFQRLSPASIVLGAGQQATITIGFTPISSGAFADTLLVVTTDLSNDTVRVPMFGQTDDPDISFFTPDRLLKDPNPELAMGGVAVGGTEAIRVAVYNAGLNILVIDSARLFGADTTFILSAGQWTNQHIAAGDSIYPFIGYKPVEKTIKVNSIDTSVTISIQNTSGLGNGRTRLTMADYVPGPGMADYTVEQAIHTITGAKDWQPWDPNVLPTLGPDSIISYRWIYHPEDTGSDNSVFRVIGLPTNSGDTINVPVMGRGSAPSISITPLFLDYGTLAIAPMNPDTLLDSLLPDTVREILVMISNTGSDDLIIDTLLTLNAGAAHYNDAFVGIGFPPFPWILPPGTIDTVLGIRAKVAERKVYYDTLALVNNDPSNDPTLLYGRVVGTAPGDLGFIDTVRVSDWEQVGSLISVPIHYVFDQPIKRLSVPLKYTSDVWEFTGTGDFSNTLLERVDGQVSKYNLDSNTIVISGTSVFGPPITPDPFIGTVLIKLLFFAKPGVSSTDSSLSFDTSFVAPDAFYFFEDDRARVIIPEFVPNRLNIVTDVDDGVRPLAFELEQNYPNPFNPNTSIRFTVPEATRVSLVVFNLLGQKVRTLVDGPMPAGRHEVEWRARDDEGQPVSSGIYFYHLVAEDHTETRKMVLMK